MMIRLRPLMLGPVVVLLLISCGGSGSPAGSNNPPQRGGSAESAFLHRAEAICDEAAAQLRPLGSAASVSQYSDEAVTKFRVATPIYRMLVIGFRQLQPPLASKATFDEVIEQFERVADKGEHLVAAGDDSKKKVFEVMVPEFFSLLDGALGSASQISLSCQ